MARVRRKSTERLLLLLLPKTMISSTSTTLPMERHLLASIMRIPAARHPLTPSLKTMVLTRLHREFTIVKQTRLRMFPRQSGRTSKLSRRAQDAEQGSAIMTKAKTAASQAKTAHKSAKKAKKAAARL
ncbi:hypothetical protein BCR37DRAFT_380566 [Protomyces lactucae-debilis]|uniref:Uncharacterized protein n=1 Tax=Protomyces lactucae-debilis TaxID=2754530 RepID=A0A1Y2FA71_PROLT|nr:uncharacterized protein BCR37DRAFT_380566 [Protomyces lactucae-debilis]ORY80808.1 hypothetical protein BCR37DRAFT_380566 [Protomyces lactucae-debilis]